MSIFNELRANRQARYAEIASRKTYQVVRLTTAGKPSQTVSPIGFNDPESARLYVARIRGYNAGRVLRYTINGVEA